MFVQDYGLSLELIFLDETPKAICQITSWEDIPIVPFADLSRCTISYKRRLKWRWQRGSGIQIKDKDSYTPGPILNYIKEYWSIKYFIKKTYPNLIESFKSKSDRMEASIIVKVKSNNNLTSQE